MKIPRLEVSHTLPTSVAAEVAEVHTPAVALSVLSASVPSLLWTREGSDTWRPSVYSREDLADIRPSDAPGDAWLSGHHATGILARTIRAKSGIPAAWLSGIVPRWAGIEAWYPVTLSGPMAGAPRQPPPTVTTSQAATITALLWAGCIYMAPYWALPAPGSRLVASQPGGRVSRLAHAARLRGMTFGPWLDVAIGARPDPSEATPPARGIPHDEIPRWRERAAALVEILARPSPGVAHPAIGVALGSEVLAYLP